MTYPFMKARNLRVIQVLSYSSSINFTLKTCLLLSLSISIVIIINLKFDQFLDVYVINSLTGWYPCLRSFPRLSYTFLMKTLLFQRLKSSYLIGSEKAIKSKIFSLTYKPDKLIYRLSLILFPSFFPFLTI